MIELSKDYVFTLGNVFLMSSSSDGSKDQARQRAIEMYRLSAEAGHEGAQGMLNTIRDSDKNREIKNA